MEFGLLLTSHPDPKSEPYPHHAIHARVTREVIEAEELGFDSIWIAEHHFSNRYGILPESFDPESDPIDVYETDRAYWESLWHRSGE